MSDEISHCVVCPNSQRNMRVGKYNTSCTMAAQVAEFDGIDSFTITTEGAFSSTSVMLAGHEALSVHCRPDINELVSRKVLEGQMTQGHATSIRDLASERYGDLSSSLRGSSYVTVDDSMLLHRHPQNESVPAVVKDSNGQERRRGIRRSWNPTINFIATEDPEGFGTTMKACKAYSCDVGDATAILWNISAMFLSCAELWYATDRKSKPFRHDSYEGHLLAHLHSTYMKHCEGGRQVGSPFSGSLSMAGLLDQLEKKMPNRSSDEDELQEFYGVGYTFLRSLFELSDHKRVRVKDGNLSSTDNTLPDVAANDSVDVVICVSEECPDEGCVEVATTDGEVLIYEARSVVCTRRIADGIAPGRFECERYCRNGKGFYSWWRQDRKAKSHRLLRRHRPPDSSMLGEQSYIPSIDNDSGNVVAFVTVFAKVVPSTVNKHKLEFHKLLGGQHHLYCR